MSAGERLREERNVAGLTQTAFAEMCGVKKLAQIRFETDAQLPGGAYLIAAAHHGVDVRYVLTGERGIERIHEPLDVGLLTDCLDAVERYLKAARQTLAPTPKARLAVLCYEEFRNTARSSRAKILAFVKQAA